MKDVLYLETDEEITTAIDKMLAMKGDSVSIVVPKRSGLLQSIVNLKLMKKAADDAGKKLVLVTGDRTATHLAGKVGLAVAASLKAEPIVPEAPGELSDDTSEIVEGDEGEEESAGMPAVSSVPEGMGPVKLDDMPADEDESEEPETVPAKAKAERKDKPDFAKPMLVRTPIKEDETAATSPKKAGVKVPNFSAFQKRTLIVGGVIGLLVVGWLLNFFLESAKVTLYVQGQQVAASFDFTVDPAANSSNYSSAILSGQTLTSTKTLTGNFKATGTKDVGTKATGTINISNCYSTSPVTLPAGTQFTSSSGLIFVSSAAATIPGGTGSFFSGCTSPGTGSVSVTAAQNGDQYNLSSGTKYSVQGYPYDSKTGMVGTGSQMSGGTTKTVNVVQQSDIDGAKAQALQADLSGAQQALEGKVPTGFTPIGESFVQTPGSVTSSAQVGDQADNGTVTIQVTYTELAVNKADYHQLIQVQEQKIVGTQNQIYDDGSSSAKITAGQAASPGGKQDFHFAATAAAGQRLNSATIAKNMAGKKLGEASDYANQQSGVQQVIINISPGWDGNMPAFSNRIQIIIKVANGG